MTNRTTRMRLKRRSLAALAAAAVAAPGLATIPAAAAGDMMEQTAARSTVDVDVSAEFGRGSGISLSPSSVPAGEVVFNFDSPEFGDPTDGQSSIGTSGPREFYIVERDAMNDYLPKSTASGTIDLDKIEGEERLGRIDQYGRDSYSIDLEPGYYVVFDASSFDDKATLTVQ